jgi:hypothetical protein
MVSLMPGSAGVLWPRGRRGGLVGLEEMVSHWRLDETGGTRVDSHGSNDLTDNNTVTQSAGRIGQAAQFTLANLEYLSCTGSSSLQCGDVSFSVAAWVYFDTKSHYRFIASKDGSSSGQREWVLVYDSVADRLQFVVFRATDSAVGVNAASFGSPSVGSWLFVCGWHDASADLIGICVNNGSADTASTGGSLQSASSGEFRIGSSAKFPAQYMMDGRIDSVSIWKRVLTSEERGALYNAGSGLDYAFG